MKTGLFTIILFVAGIAIYVLSMIMLPTENMLVIPENYEKVCSIKMSDKHENAEVYKFETKEQVKAGFYIWTNSHNDKNLVFEGSNNTKMGLLAGDAKLTNSEFKLQPGSYSLKLSNTPQSGTLVIYAMKAGASND